MPTPDELIAQRADLDRQIAIANLPGLKAMKAALGNGKAGTLADDLTALLPQLATDNTMGSHFQQANALISTLRGVTAMFEREIVRIEGLADADSGATQT